MNYDLQAKVIIIGNSAVGKTSMLLRYADSRFSPSYITTIGIDFKTKIVKHEDKRVKLQIWDTAGQERFKSLTLSYLKGSDIVILCYDISDESSFEAVTSWISSVKDKTEADVQMVLVGNKSDMKKREISYEEGKTLADKYRLPFFECSAKTGAGIDELFRAITVIAVRLYDRPMRRNKSKVSLRHAPEKKGCC